MEHRTETFNFTDTEGKPVEVKSRKFNFKLEEIIIQRFGKDKLTGFSEGKNVSFEFGLAETELDMPRLLEIEDIKINWSDQDVEEVSRVYFFFITYRQSAFFDQMRRLNATFVSKLLKEMGMEALTPQNISEILKRSNINSSFSGTKVS